MRYKLILLLGFVVLAGCGQAAEQTSSLASSTSGAGGLMDISTDKLPPPPPPPATLPPPELVERAPKIDVPAQNQVQTPIITTPMLAYSYTVSFLLPKDKVGVQLQAHQDACQKAGANICQIVSSSISDNEDNRSANLSLRAEPKWLESFRAGFEKSAQANGGKITNSETTSEDLTRYITDTEARLRAQTLLRTRLENILATHQGKMADLLEAETQLTEVQGNIDSMNSDLAVAKSRVQMSVLNLSYSSKANAVSNGAFAPLTEAFTSFFRIMAKSLALVISAIAAILPIGIIIIPIFMWIRKFWAVRKAKKAADKSST